MNEPFFNKDPNVAYVWYSWSEKRGKWCRSCWEAPTREEAEDMLAKSSCSELWNYQNQLVKEYLTFTPLATMVALPNGRTQR